jgi:hypothetical protein
MTTRTTKFIPSADYGVRCIHGVLVWIGHECGGCEGAGEYRTHAPRARISQPWSVPASELVIEP